MTLKIGWFTTGRDQAARNLLETVYRDISSNGIPASIDWIFSHRETGDGPFNDEYMERELLFDLAAHLDIPVATLSHIRFMPELRRKGLAESPSALDASPNLLQWRNLFGQEVVRVVGMLPPVDIVVMAGYMLIIGQPELETLQIINIHPALPWGPRGTWQEVIHQLIAENAHEQGIMVHLVTSELDRGPVISYCRFPIHGRNWNPLWDLWQRDMELGMTLPDKENHLLFKEIRKHGEVRELPLLRAAIRELAYGNISIREKQICQGGRKLSEGLDLTWNIETIVAGD